VRVGVARLGCVERGLALLLLDCGDRGSLSLSSSTGRSVGGWVWYGRALVFLFSQGGYGGLLGVGFLVEYYICGATCCEMISVLEFNMSLYWREV
jgi:hypothetical protein